MSIHRRPLLVAQHKITATRLTSLGKKPTSTGWPKPTEAPRSLPADLLQAATSRGIQPALGHQNQSTDEQTAMNTVALSTSRARKTAGIRPAKPTTAMTTSTAAPSVVDLATKGMIAAATTTAGTGQVPTTAVIPAATGQAPAVIPAAATSSLLYRLALAGREPAESLPTEQRERLIRVLWGRGWTDEQIATHTKETTYTVARIRGRIGLAPHCRAA